ncbi:MAG: allantoate amidohydrolase [Chitinophagaceae bacterium]|nr:allantoate amidohydrolase [Chitinophagaceae bacterium]
MNTGMERAHKILERINWLASVSEDENCITRTYGTAAFAKGREKVEQWMKEAGLHTRTDNIGNIRGRLLSKDPKAKTFVIASHIDTIINAGKFDGPLGVLMGLDIIEELIRSKTELPFHIELIGFCDEEGCRFHTTYLGSKVVAGSFDSSVLDTKDAAGISLEEVIRMNGGHVNHLSKDAIAKEDWLGYFEIHIEQGPVLYEKDIPVAVVTAIAGQYRAGIVFNGEAGHAGTVPMDMRKDALACAAAFILAVERFAKENKQTIVATVGKTHIVNVASNVIPGEVICSLDLRSADETRLLAAYEEIKRVTEDICEKRNIVPEWNLIQQSAPVNCDERMKTLMLRSITDAGYVTVELVSGAGHDAVPVSAVSPVVMLFVRCFKGISHHPAEDVEIKDIAAAIKVSDNFIQQLIKTNNLQ